jgi:hypothetical protein
MRITNMREWLMIMTCALFGIFTFSGIYYLIDRAVASAKEVHNPLKSGVPSAGEHTSLGSNDAVRHWVMAASDRSPAAVPRRVILKLDQAARIGKADITYRGLESGSKFRIDVVIPEFDPQAFYPYRLNISEAKKGFRLARRKYRLISAHKAYVHLYLLE